MRPLEWLKRSCILVASMSVRPARTDAPKFQAEPEGGNAPGMERQEKVGSGVPAPVSLQAKTGNPSECLEHNARRLT